MSEKEPTENYTYADLLADLQKLDAKQLNQQARWIDERGNGKVRTLWVLDGHHIDPSGEGLEPVANYLPKEGEAFNAAEHMTDAELLAEQTWPDGLVLLSHE